MYGPVAGAAVRHRLLAGGLDRQHVHAVDRLARDAEGLAAGVERRGRGGALERGAHRVLVVLDHEDAGQLPQRAHVEGLVDLALVRRAVAEIGEADVVVAAVPVGEGEAGADRHLRADDAVAAVEVLLLGEHVHRAALAAGVAARAAGQLGHHALGVHAAGEHVAVVAIGGDALVAVLRGGLEPDHDRLLADVEMAEAADQAHAVELAGLLLEAADQQHLAVEVEQLVLGRGRLLRGCAARCRHRLVPPDPLFV